MCSVVASLTGEMAARGFVYHAHETADSDKSQGLCAMTKHKSAMDARSGSPPDDKSSCLIMCLCASVWAGCCKDSAKPCMHLHLNCIGNKNSTQPI